MPQKKKRQLRRIINRVLGGAFVLGVVGLLVFAWMPKPVPVVVQAVDRGDVVVTVDEDGQTRVKDRYVVSAPLAGHLERIELRPGDMVKKGQTVARLVPLSAPLLDVRSREQAEARVAAANAALRQSRAQVERIQTSLDFANKELQRQKGLAAQDVISQQALDKATLEQRSLEAELTSSKFGSQVASYELRMAEAALGRVKGVKSAGDNEQLEVTSPVDGRVLRLINESEGVVQAGAQLLEVGDPVALEVVVEVLTKDAVNIHPGAAVSIEAWGGVPLQAHVRRVEPSAFTEVSSLGVEEQRVNALVDLDSPYEQWSALMDGFRIEARIVTGSAKGVLRVPMSALFRREEGWALYAVQDERAVLRRVEVGKQNGLQAEIVSGLTLGEQVVIHPSDRVADGVRVAR